MGDATYLSSCIWFFICIFIIIIPITFTAISIWWRQTGFTFRTGRWWFNTRWHNIIWTIIIWIRLIRFIFIICFGWMYFLNSMTNMRCKFMIWSHMMWSGWWMQWHRSITAAWTQKKGKYRKRKRKKQKQNKNKINFCLLQLNVSIEMKKKKIRKVMVSVIHKYL